MTVKYEKKRGKKLKEKLIKKEVEEQEEDICDI